MSTFCSIVHQARKFPTNYFNNYDPTKLFEIRIMI